MHIEERKTTFLRNVHVSSFSRGPAPMNSTPFTDTGDSIGVLTPPLVSPYITLKTHPQVHSTLKMPKHTCRGDGTTPLPWWGTPSTPGGNAGPGYTSSLKTETAPLGGLSKRGEEGYPKIFYPKIPF
ncbi:hypothetical protein, unlikely [Trypanosoma congolense IL3000]|uniref:Uncharacterized protein n=1 Tax=Trypanosoma congolense (strain IL3000) TaxID=1068625 RepID=F9WAS3_TRYCI|nr:hypothetical protein, unlikely [Trypanosoma congolense IL3000]